QQLVLRVLLAPLPIVFDQSVIRISSLRVLVEVLHVGMGRRAIEIEITLLGVLTMVPFSIVQSEQAFFQDRILPVPKRQGKAENSIIVTNARQSVLAPVISARPRLI